MSSLETELVAVRTELQTLQKLTDAQSQNTADGTEEARRVARLITQHDKRQGCKFTSLLSGFFQLFLTKFSLKVGHSAQFAHLSSKNFPKADLRRFDFATTIATVFL